MKTIQKSFLGLAVLIIGLITIFLFSTGFKNIDSNKESPTTHVVTIYKMKFNPENIKVKKGDLIEWINKDFVPHDVTENNKKWRSNPLKQGDTFSKVIKEDAEYFCSIHVVMKGSVTILK